MTAPAHQPLWSRLRDAGLVGGDPPARGDPPAPWFVRVMLGAAGWLGALFLLGFVGVGYATVLDRGATSFGVGAAACAGALLLFRAPVRSEFLSQFGLAVSFAGQLLMAYGLTLGFGDPIALTAAALTLQQAVLFMLAPQYLHRIWTAASAVAAAVFALYSADLQAFVPAAVTFVLLWSWLAEFDQPQHGRTLRAAGYGIALAAALVAAMHGTLLPGWSHEPAEPGVLGGPLGYGLGRLLLGLVLVWAVLRWLDRERIGRNTGRGRGALAAAAVLALAALEVPGLGPAAAILVIGFANGNRLLTGLGVVTLLGCLSHYYYALHATLLAKSALLAGTGVVLLATRHALRRRWASVPELPHA